MAERLFFVESVEDLERAMDAVRAILREMSARLDVQRGLHVSQVEDDGTVHVKVHYLSRYKRHKLMGLCRKLALADGVLPDRDRCRMGREGERLGKKLLRKGWQRDPVWAGIFSPEKAASWGEPTVLFPTSTPRL